MTSLDIVIVNWNAGQQLYTCIDSIFSAMKRGLNLRQVVVVDNDSRDNSADGLQRLGYPLHVLRNKSNRGFAAACNQGAVAGNSDYILFLNPDTCLFADSLIKPLMFMEEPSNRKFGIVGIQLVGKNGSISRTCTRFPTAAMFFFRMLGLDRLLPNRRLSHFMSEWDHRQNRGVDHVIGAFFLVRRSTFYSLEGFDERFFVYLEDLDFSLRAQKVGWQSYYFADAQAFHEGGGTSGQVKDQRLYYAVCSHIRYAYKNFNWWSATFLMLGMLFLEPWLRIGLAIKNRSRAQLSDTVKAYALLWRKFFKLIGYMN